MSSEEMGSLSALICEQDRMTGITAGILMRTYPPHKGKVHTPNRQKITEREIGIALWGG